MHDLKDAWSERNDDGYYVSINDMLIGLLFLFIILLMYFALQLRNTNEDLVTSEQTRDELLNKVAQYLRDRDVPAEVDVSAGLLRLPDRILFEKGWDSPKDEGVEALEVLAEALAIYLPCYTYGKASLRPPSCRDTPHHLETIFIEGHTDSDPIAPTARLHDNWDLSSARASNTYRILTAHRPSLLDFRSATPGQPSAMPIFSVAGYADQRPVSKGNEEADMSRNRRIDVRFVMAGPD